MPSFPFYNTFDKGVNGAALQTTDTGSGDQFTQVTTTVAPTYDNTIKRGAMSCKITQPAVTPGLCSVAFNPLGVVTATQWFRMYMWTSAWQTNLYSLLMQSYNSSGALGATAGMNPGSGVGTPSCLVMFDATGSVVANGSVALPLSQWLRFEWMLTPGAGTGAMEYRAYNEANQMLDRIAGSSLTLLANTDFMFFGDLAGNQASYSFWIDGLRGSTDGWIGPDDANYIPSLGRRPVPMIKGPDIDRLRRILT